MALFWIVENLKNFIVWFYADLLVTLLALALHYRWPWLRGPGQWSSTLLALLTCLWLMLHPGRGAEYCDQPICLCVCLSVCEHISGTGGPIFTIFCVQIPCGRGSVLIRRRCATLCTSGFMDDVTFGRS